jgi:hypothetical protein
MSGARIAAAKAEDLTVHLAGETACPTTANQAVAAVVGQAVSPVERLFRSIFPAQQTKSKTSNRPGIRGNTDNPVIILLTQ